MRVSVRMLRICGHDHRHTRNADEQSRQKGQDADDQAKRAVEPCPEARDAPGLSLIQAVVRIVQPESTDDSVGVPACEEGGGEGDQVREYGHANCKDECRAVHDQYQDRPGRPALECVLLDMSSSPEEADEEEFRGRVGV